MLKNLNYSNGQGIKNSTRKIVFTIKKVQNYNQAYVVNENKINNTLKSLKCQLHSWNQKICIKIPKKNSLTVIIQIFKFQKLSRYSNGIHYFFIYR